jgi:L-ascorbate metabolism protein UlaG (beta-lactamase superfamily)
VLGVVRLYLEVKEWVPEHHRPPITTPIIDCDPEEAQLLKRRLQRQGYTVLAVPL